MNQLIEMPWPFFNLLLQDKKDQEVSLAQEGLQFKKNDNFVPELQKIILVCPNRQDIPLGS